MLFPWFDRNWKPSYNKIIYSLLDLRPRNVTDICREWDKGSRTDQHRRIGFYCSELLKIGILDVTQNSGKDSRVKGLYKLNVNSLIEELYKYNKKRYGSYFELDLETKEKLAKVFETEFVYILRLINEANQKDNVFENLTNWFLSLLRYAKELCEYGTDEEKDEFVRMFKNPNRALRLFENRPDLINKLEIFLNKPKKVDKERGKIIYEGLTSFRKSFRIIDTSEFSEKTAKSAP